MVTELSLAFLAKEAVCRRTGDLADAGGHPWGGGRGGVPGIQPWSLSGFITRLKELLPQD